jgi:MFS family permease
MPLMAGSLVASTIVGSLVTRTGRYKPFMLAGTVSFTIGLFLLSTIDTQTSFVALGVYQALVGIGMGACMQNLVLAAQNSADIRQIGVATATVTFFRMLGGAVGVAVLGAVLSSRVAGLVTDGLSRLGLDTLNQAGGTVPDPSTLPPPIARVIEAAYAHGMADLFLAALPFGLLAILAVALMPEHPLGTKNGIVQLAEARSRGPEPGPAR